MSWKFYHSRPGALSAPTPGWTRIERTSFCSSFKADRQRRTSFGAYSITTFAREIRDPSTPMSCAAIFWLLCDSHNLIAASIACLIRVCDTLRLAPHYLLRSSIRTFYSDGADCARAARRSGFDAELYACRVALVAALQRMCAPRQLAMTYSQKR